MGRRKKRGRKSSSRAGESKTQMDFRPFAALADRRDALKDDDDQARQRQAAEREKRARQAKDAAGEGRPMVAAQQWIESGSVEMSDEALFAAAVEDLDGKGVYEGKFGSGGQTVNHIAGVTQPPPGSSEPYASDDALFLAEFGDELVRVEDKYHVAQRAAEIEVDAMYRLLGRDRQDGPSSAELLESLLDPSGPALSRPQHQLLEDAKKRRRTGAEIKEINLRGMSREVGLQALESASTSERYLRVITGKGLQSAGEPVLKVAVVSWCIHHDVDWAPEVLADQSFGSFMLRFRRPR